MIPNNTDPMPNAMVDILPRKMKRTARAAIPPKTAGRKLMKGILALLKYQPTKTNMIIMAMVTVKAMSFFICSALPTATAEAP